MKYIDADKIRNAIESEADNWQDTYTDCMRDNLLTILDSLQQEQLPGIEDPGIPGKDFIPVDWVDACEKYGKWKIVKVK